MFTYFFTPQKNAFISQTLTVGFFLTILIFTVLGSLSIFTQQVLSSFEIPLKLSTTSLLDVSTQIAMDLIWLMWTILCISNYDKFKFSHYELNNDIIHVSTGFALKRDDMYLFAKDIQHITIQSDLISRRLGHFDVVIYTAGTNHKLHCLSKTNADFIKDFLEKRNC